MHNRFSGSVRKSSSTCIEAELFVFVSWEDDAVGDKGAEFILFRYVGYLAFTEFSAEFGPQGSQGAGYTTKTWVNAFDQIVVIGDYFHGYTFKTFTGDSVFVWVVEVFHKLSSASKSQRTGRIEASSEEENSRSSPVSRFSTDSISMLGGSSGSRGGPAPRTPPRESRQPLEPLS